MQQGLVRLVRPLATPTRFFVVVALLTGLAVVTLARPFAGDDEQTHFYRAYAITRADLMLEVRGQGVGSDIPGGVVDEVTRLFALGTSPRSDALHRWNASVPDGADEFVSYPMATLSPIGHAPAAIGIGVGRLFGGSPLLLMYLGRLANLLAYIGIVFAVLRAIPVLRWPLTFAALFPNSIMVAGTVSPDAFAVALVIAAIGLALLMRDRVARGVPIGTAAWVASFATAIGLGNAKAPYFLAIGVFILPWLRTRGADRRAVTAVAAVTIVIGAIWAVGFSDRYVLGAYVGRQHATSIERLLGGLPHPGGLDSSAQWTKLRENPARFAVATSHMVTRQGSHLLSESMLDYGLWRPPWLLSLFGFAFLVGARFSTPEEDRARLRGSERVLAWLLFLGIGGIMLLSLFVYDTTAQQGSLEVLGMQGRYVAPLIPLLVLAVPAVPRLRARLGWVQLGQVVLSGIVVFAVAHGTFPSVFDRIFAEVLR